MPDLTVIEMIAATRIIAILRGDFRGAEPEIAEVLRDAGIRAVEVTLNSPDALESIALLAAKFDGEMVIGAGTVLQTGQVELAADAGAQFIISPNCDLPVIAATKKLDLTSLPGCFTPSEIVRAFEAGADAVKIFPANVLGASFVRGVLAPLGNVRLVPTGGVTTNLAVEFIKAGAWAIGVGSELVSEKLFSAPNGFEQLAARASDFVEAVK